MDTYVESALEKSNGKTSNFFKVSGIVFCSVLGFVVLVFLGIYFFLNSIYTDTLYDDSVPIIDCNDPNATYLPSAEELTPVFVDILIKKDTTEYSLTASDDIKSHFTDDIKVLAKYSHAGTVYEEELTDYEIVFDDDIFESEGKKKIVLKFKNIEALGLCVNANAEIPINIIKEEANLDSPFDSALTTNSVSITYDTSSLYEWDKIYSEENYEKIKTGYLQPIFKKDQIDPDILNILIITTEKNKIVPEAKRNNISILTVMSYDFNTGEATTFNIDEKTLGTYYGKAYSLNGVWAIGGPGAVINSLNNLLQLDIQRYVLMDSNSLIDLVNVVGDIKIKLTQDEIDRLGFEGVTPGRVALNYEMSDVYISLDGPDKSARQQKFTYAVLTQVFNNLTMRNFKSTVSKITFAKTNISSDMLFNYIFFKGVDIANLAIDKYKAPFGEFGRDYAFSITKENYAMYYMDVESLRQLVYEHIGY